MKTGFPDHSANAMKPRFIESAARLTFLVGVLVTSLFGGSSVTYASDPIGVYAIVDKVVFEPGADNAERVQVWGVFSFAVKGTSDAYEEPKAGYLYYQIKAGDESKSRKEWSDL